jgi:hypothetical protein
VPQSEQWEGERVPLGSGGRGHLARTRIGSEHVQLSELFALVPRTCRGGHRRAAGAGADNFFEFCAGLPRSNVFGRNALVVLTNDGDQILSPPPAHRSRDGEPTARSEAPPHGDAFTLGVDSPPRIREGAR